MNIAKLRNEDLSMFFFVRSTLSGKVSNILDAFPYHELQDEALTLPAVSVEHDSTREGEIGELGSLWYTRTWVIEVFGRTKTERDEISALIITATESAIPIRDYSGGYTLENGSEKDIIEYAHVTDRSIRTAYNFASGNRNKYFRSTVRFSTTTTNIT